MYSYRTQNNKRPVETFIVQKTGVEEWVNDNASAELYDSGSPIAGIFPGMIGFLEYPLTGSAMPIATGAPSTSSPFAIFEAGSDINSLPQSWQTQTYPLVPQATITSGVINPMDSITATRQDYQAPTNTVWVIGDTGASATGGIQALDNTEYALTIGYRGYITDMMFSPEGTAFYTPSYVTPDYTSLSTSFPVDHLVQNLGWQVLRNSLIIGQNYDGNEPVVALALDLTGTAGTLVSTLTAGFLPLVNTSAGVRGITADADLVTTLKAALPSGSSIVTIDVTTAGSADNAQALAILALDRRLSFQDEIPQVKIDIDLGLRYGFDVNQVYNVQTSFPFEGQGTYRQLNLKYRATHGQRRYNLDHEQFPVIEYPTSLDSATNYSVITVESRKSAQVDTFNVVESPQMTIVCIPDAYATMVDDFVAGLDAWLAANNKPAVLEI